MGLMIHSLGELPLNAKRDYYVYLLDYGWHEPLGQALLSSFDTMAAEASSLCIPVRNEIVTDVASGNILRPGRVLI